MIEIKSTKMQNRNLKQALNSGLRVMKGEMATEIFFFFFLQVRNITFRKAQVLRIKITTNDFPLTHRERARCYIAIQRWANNIPILV